MRAMLAVLALAALAAPGPAEPPRFRIVGEPDPPPPPPEPEPRWVAFGPLDYACPKCGADRGAECRPDARRHRFHLARVQLAERQG